MMLPPKTPESMNCECNVNPVKKLAMFVRKLKSPPIAVEWNIEKEIDKDTLDFVGAEQYPPVDHYRQRRLAGFS
jgi:hypothetical protein